MSATFRQVPDLQLVKLQNGMDVLVAVQQYRANPDVLYAEPDYRVFATATTPNDPLFPLTWGLQNDGSQNGVPGADIHATSAWQLSTGSRNVVVGSLDTGVDYNHQDLAANIYHNTPDCNSNGVDDDGNGWVDDCIGLNVTFNGNPSNDPMDYVQHGTHTSGTIGAVGNNGVGVAGVNWQVSIIPCKSLDFDGGTTSQALQCLDYMAWMKQHGVNIIATNNSWSGGFYSQALYDAIQAQMQLGILFIAAAGNGDAHGNSSDNDINPVYPASYDLPNVIAVAATDRRDELASFSNYGRHSVALGAPGVSVISTTPFDSYQSFSGTSMATPHVTGAAALLKAQGPSRDWIAIKNLLLASGDPDPSLAGTITQKRLNVYNAMTCSNQSVLERLQPRNDVITTTSNNPVLLRMLHINCAAPAGTVNASLQPGGTTIQLLDGGAAPDQIAGDGVYSALWTPSQPGEYTLSFPNGDVVTVDVLRPYNFSTGSSTYTHISGTNLSLDDEETATVDLPFPIHFGGQIFRKIYISDNGIITFDRAFNVAVPLPMPWPDAGAIVAPWWDDLQPVFPGDNNVFWDVVGAAPTRQLVIEWRNVAHYPFAFAYGGTVTFEAVFHEDRDEVDFNYSTVKFGTPWWGDGGASAGVGVQVGAAEGTLFSYGAASLTPGLSLVWQLANPDFSVNLTSSTQTAFVNQASTFAGTVSALFGFNSQVNISCAGTAPSMCAGPVISPVHTGTPFTLTAASAIPGTYNFQVKAQSAATAITHQVPATLNVIDFAVSAPTPSSLTIADGDSATASFNVSGFGPFNGQVALSCAGLPAGLTCSFSPSAVVTVTSGTPVPITVGVQVPNKTSLASHTITIVATTAGAPASKTAAFSITVLSNADFFLTAPVTAVRSFAAGSATAAMIIDRQDGYSGNVALSCSVVPSGPTCSIAPGTISSFPTAASVTIAANGAGAGLYQVTVTGTGSSKSHSLLMTYQIVSYGIAAASAFVAYPTAVNQLVFTITPLAGYRGIVNVGCDVSALPTGIQCDIAYPSVDFSQGTTGADFISIWVPVGTRGGTFPLIITTQDANGPPETQTVVNVTIKGFTFVAGQGTQTVLVGNTSGPFDMTLTPYGGYNLPTQIEPWTCNPAGATCNISPSSTITPNGSPVHLTMTVDLPVQEALSTGGDYSFNVFGSATDSTTGASLWVPLDTPLTLHVQDYALVPSVTQFKLPPGSSYVFQITNRQFNGLDVPVSLSCPSPLPPGVSCSIDKPTLASGGVANVTFSATTAAPPSLRQFDITGVATVSGQTIRHILSLQAWIAHFSLSIAPETITVPAGGNGWFAINVSAFGLQVQNAIATVSCTSPDPGITCDAPYEIPAWLGDYRFYVNVRTADGVTPVGAHPFTVALTQWGETLSISGTITMQGADSLIVVTPNGGELWSSGTQNISWRYTGNPGSTVRLELLNKGQLAQTIANSVAIGALGKGFYSWQIPASLPFSQFYTVRVTSIANPSITDTSDERTWIGQGADLNVPNTGQVFYAGGVMFINYTWSTYSNLRFDLYKGGQFVQTLLQQGSGYFDWPGWQWDAVWNIPQTIAPGIDYSIKIVPVDAPSRAVMSGNFTISQTGITVTSPVGGEVWHLGTAHTITWTWMGNPVSPGVDVQISLNSGSYPGGGGSITLTTPIGANGSGSYTWTVPNTIPPRNDYTVTVAAFSPEGTLFAGNSPRPFAIGNFHNLSVVMNGSGWVHSADFSINCTPTCSGLYAQGTSVTLTALSAAGYQFTGWSGGACSGTGDCAVVMNSDLSVTANFIALTPDLSVSAQPDSTTIPAGGRAQYAIRVVPQGGLTGNATFSCLGLPQGTKCSFQPSSVSLSTGGATTTLFITTTGSSSASLVSIRWSSYAAWFPLLLAMGIGLQSLPKKHRAHMIAVLIFASLLTSCGGSTSSGPPPPPPPVPTPSGTYTITVTAQAGTTQRTTLITLIVQ